MRKIPRLPVSPMSLVCPHCNSKRGQDCTTTKVGFSAIHIERIQLAAFADEIGALRDRARLRRTR
jgi:hypothetical protein